MHMLLSPSKTVSRAHVGRGQINFTSYYFVKVLYVLREISVTDRSEKQENAGKGNPT